MAIPKSCWLVGREGSHRLAGIVTSDVDLIVTKSCLLQEEEGLRKEGFDAGKGEPITMI